MTTEAETDMALLQGKERLGLLGDGRVRKNPSSETSKGLGPY